jgi:hypothetical protein
MNGKIETGDSGLKYVYIVAGVCAVCCLAWAFIPRGEETQSAPAPQMENAPGNQDASKLKEPGVVKLPGLKVDIKNKEVRLDAEVCLEEGILEYLVCLPGTFEHEAIFVTRTKPEHLHAGLVMIGRRPYPFRDVFWWHGIEKQVKSHLSIEAEWKNGDETKRMPLHKLLVNRGHGDDVTGHGEFPPEARAENDETQDGEIVYAENAWVFSGSFFHRREVEGGEVEVYAANIGGIVIAIWPQPSSVVQYGRETLNPYRGENQGFEINVDQCPEKGTKVELIFSPRKKPLKLGDDLRK